MKIGILTYLSDSNFGTFTQAYATYRILKENIKGAKIEFVNVRHRKRFRVFPPGMKELLRGKILAFNEHVTRFYRFRTALKKIPMSKPVLVTQSRENAINYIKKRQYDLLIVGADIILKYIGSPDILTGEKPPIYWLPADIGCSHVMLASSSCITTYEMLKDWQKEMIRDCVNGFDLLAVRDEMTFKFIVDAGIQNSNKMMLVSDPTFVFTHPTENAAKYVKKNKHMHCGRKIIGIRAHDTPLINSIVEKLKEKYTVAAIVPGISRADIQCHGIGPFEWMGIFKYFAAHITISFHDSIFCIKNGTPPILIDESDRPDPNTGYSKNKELYQNLGIHESYFNPSDKNFRIKSVLERVEMVVATSSVATTQKQLENMGKTYMSAIHKIKKLI